MICDVNIPTGDNCEITLSRNMSPFLMIPHKSNPTAGNCQVSIGYREGNRLDCVQSFYSDRIYLI
jgi:hypothetical protein